MPIRIYNTLTRKKEELKTLEETQKDREGKLEELFLRDMQPDAALKSVGLH